MKTKTLLGAAGVAASLSALIAGVPAFSAPAGAAVRTPTTITVTALDPLVTSGKPVVFFAQVSPVKVGKIRVGGTVTWILTGRNGGRLSCTVATPLNHGGKSKCRIEKDALRSATAPITVTAKYSGDSTFAPSSASTTQEADAGVTRVHVVMPVKPTSDASTLIQAYMKDGPGTGLIVGNVTFVITSGLSRAGVTTTCEGQFTPASVIDSKPVLGGVATCRLRAGWIVNPPSTGPHSSKRTSWSITATYVGSRSFSSSTSTHSGHAIQPLT